MDVKEAKRICNIAIGETVVLGAVSAILSFFHVLGDMTQAFMAFFAILAILSLSARKNELNKKNVTESFTYLMAVDFVACLAFVFYVFFVLGRNFIGMI